MGCIGISYSCDSDRGRFGYCKTGTVYQKLFFGYEAPKLDFHYPYFGESLLYCLGFHAPKG